jgi:hypothetical protein
MDAGLGLEIGTGPGYGRQVLAIAVRDTVFAC